MQEALVYKRSHDSWLRIVITIENYGDLLTTATVEQFELYEDGIPRKMAECDECRVGQSIHFAPRQRQGFRMNVELTRVDPARLSVGSLGVEMSMRYAANAREIVRWHFKGKVNMDSNKDFALVGSEEVLPVPSPTPTAAQE